MSDTIIGGLIILLGWGVLFGLALALSAVADRGGLRETFRRLFK